jgi:hypothetical protein
MMFSGHEHRYPPIPPVVAHLLKVAGAICFNFDRQWPSTQCATAFCSFALRVSEDE